MTDSNSSKLVETIEQISEGFDHFSKTTGEKVETLSDRLEKIEASNDRPKGGPHNGASRDELEHKDRFCNWLRDPHGHAVKAQLVEAESEMSRKAVTIGTNSAGGFAVPAIIADEIESRVRVQNPFRQLVRVVEVGSSSYSHLVSKNSAGYAWVGEGGSRSETSTSDLVQVAPTHGVIYALPKCSEEALQDVFFDVGEWLVEEVSDAFSAGEAAAIWNGNGSDKPSGLINTTPSATDDTASPERDQSALEYLPITATSSPFTVAGVQIDDLIDLAYSVHERYLTPPDSVAWIMRRSTASHVRRLKDSDGAYYWQPSTMAGQPDTLLGFPVFQSDAIDAHGTANAFPIAYGNFRRGYLFTVRQAIEITVDSNISTKGQTLFYVRRRVGGKVLNNQAVKLLKFALS